MADGGEALVQAGEPFIASTGAGGRQERAQPIVAATGLIHDALHRVSRCPAPRTCYPEDDGEGMGG